MALKIARCFQWFHEGNRIIRRITCYTKSQTVTYESVNPVFLFPWYGRHSLCRNLSCDIASICGFLSRSSFTFSFVVIIAFYSSCLWCPASWCRYCYAWSAWAGTFAITLIPLSLVVCTLPRVLKIDSSVSPATRWPHCSSNDFLLTHYLLLICMLLLVIKPVEKPFPEAQFLLFVL